MAEKEEKKIFPLYQDTDCGFKLPRWFSLDAFKSALNYKSRSDDLFIVTYPKCGTTWMQYIVNCIYRKGKCFTSALDFLSSTPFLEMTGAEAAEKMKRPGAIKMHLPFHLTPWSPEAKYIFVARNPKDCVVSYFYHTTSFSGYNFKNGKFDDFFDLFIEGNVDFGDYFDTLLSWYEHKNDPNVLFITYEQLKRDARTCILKIAEFMGQKYKDMLTNDESILNDVIKHSSFNYMKVTLNRQLSELSNLPKDFATNNPDMPQGLKHILGGSDKLFDSNPDSVAFVRKGIIGDFKNHLSAQQNWRLEEKFKDRTKGTDIPELWKDIMFTESSYAVLASSKPSSTPLSQFIEGLQVPAMFSIDCLRSALEYKPRPDDVFLATYPKCGTTWAQHILVLIFRQGQPLVDAIKFFANAPHLEMTGVEGAEFMSRPGAIKVHLPYRLTPRCDKAKYIYVSRNPKDCCVSYFHHMRNTPAHAFNGTFDEFFELFISGNVDYGDYFDHLVGWYAHRNDPNMLFITYEEMKEQPEKSILKMASFIDDKLYAQPLRDDPEKLQNIIRYSSFDHMKEVVNKGMDEIFGMSRDEILSSELPNSVKKMLLPAADLAVLPSFEQPKKSAFIRKGIVGDWKSYFSEEQNRRLKEKFAERTKGTDIPKLWEKYM